jgi:hypothetical protein
MGAHPMRHSETTEGTTMSWIITDRATGRAVMETFNANTAARVNTDRYRVQEAGAYLVDLNLQLQRRMQLSRRIVRNDAKAKRT